MYHHLSIATRGEAKKRGVDNNGSDLSLLTKTLRSITLKNIHILTKLLHSLSTKILAHIRPILCSVIDSGNIN